MITFAQLKEILKENQIKVYFHYTKSKLIDLLYKRGLIPVKYETIKQVKAKKDIVPKYNFLREGHSHQKTVEIHDLETDKVDLYPSIYRVALALDQNPRVIGMYNGKYEGRGTRSKC